jgi:Ca2+-binding EF-hand superfamily protein
MENLQFNYPALIKQTTEEWKIEVLNVMRCLDTEKEGHLSRDAAIHAMGFFGINGEEHFHFSKKLISVKMFLTAVQHERERNADAFRRWKYIFSLIAGPGNEAITKERLKAFFTMFGHTPDDKYCEDFIDEFDRIAIQKTEINLEDWLMFCRIHRLPF